jgi:hypothetical protein
VTANAPEKDIQRVTVGEEALIDFPSRGAEHWVS